MIRVVVAAVLIAVILNLAAGHPASAHTGRYCVTRAGNGLNLRTGPGGSYARIETMADGTAVKARGHRGNWLFLTSYTSGNTGWASLTYLDPCGGSSGGSSGSSPSGLQSCFPNSWGQTFCAGPDIVAAAWSAAQHWGASYWWLMSMASCESNFSQYAFNGLTGVSGMLQFLPSTFYAWGGSNLWSYWEQFYVAARMYVNGYASAWDCNHRF